MTELKLSRQRGRQPSIGISACLLGERVRYDGGHKQQPLIQQHIAPWLQLTSFCPEANAGLGIPRPPVQLIATDEGVKVVAVENPELDVTPALTLACETFAAERASQLVAYIVKSRSPSCGSGSTPLTVEEGSGKSYTDGLFVQALKRQNPELIIVEEESLNSEARCRDFIESCYKSWQVPKNS